MFVRDAEVNAKATAPVQFKPDIDWNDWKPTFINYLHQIPGRSGIPLDYVIRDNELLAIAETGDILLDYAMMAPLQGVPFDNDNPKVANFIRKLVVGNATAELKIQSVADDCNDRDL